MRICARNVCKDLFMRPTVQICQFSSHFSWRFVQSWSRVKRQYLRLNWWHFCEDSVCVHDEAATLPSWSSKATREQQTLHWIDAQFFMISPYHLSSTACVPQMCVWVFGFGSYQRALQVECHNKRMVPATAMSGVTCLHREMLLSRSSVVWLWTLLDGYCSEVDAAAQHLEEALRLHFGGNSLTL